MRIKIVLFIAVLLSGIFSAQQMNDYQFGAPFTISYPIGYVKSYDLNDVASAQFSSPINEKYSIVIQTEKDNLTFFQIAFSNLVEAGEHYSKAITDGLQDDKSLKYTTPKALMINDQNAVETSIEGSFFEDESELSTQLFYHVTIVETAKHYYQIISWCALKDKNKNLEEFRKIAKSFKEIK
ncbi:MULTISPECIES: hypothetical protein [unclassified Kaistella]|uniref:hypothetical protein n=1 Tax=unclassified Kaistella TaxID=2762626 RepID=UPI002733840C|nr:MULTISPECIES: hypothetical protein [unclassified Kaistella]MCZ2082772.1 hypothetical protein [Flavobacteriales bacterium]MDP2454425.1 hypothetical protein [Kaistella sp. SH11-4b]MDP2457912.1 hypothetical protein [Kaistella sp. SH40-3]MDP2460818.1 hypothetical protein [Kaistella sp. SH19-2b]